MCCFKRHFINNDEGRLKLKGWKVMCHAAVDKKAGIALFIPEN